MASPSDAARPIASDNLAPCRLEADWGALLDAPKLLEAHAVAGGGKELGLFAVRPLSAGKRLLECTPFGHALDTAELRLRCHWCLKEAPAATEFKKCSRCKTLFYCSVACQRNDWKLGHDQECACLQAAHPHVPPASVRLLSRALDRQCALGNTAAGDSVNWLASHRDQETEAVKEKLAGVLMELSKFKRQQAAWSMAHAMDVLCRIRCNSCALLSDELNSIGAGLFPRMALLNHSCRPNTVATFHGSSLVVRCIASVKVGEELTICYVDAMKPREHRRQALMSQYFFSCSCIRCVEEATDGSPLDAYRCLRSGCLSPVQASLTTCKQGHSADLQALEREGQKVEENCQRILGNQKAKSQTSDMATLQTGKSVDRIMQ